MENGNETSQNRPHAALLVLNPHSRRGDDSDVHAAIAVLEKIGLHLIKVAPDGRDKVAQAIEAHRDHVDRVIVAGGDGSINSVIDTLYTNRLALAILPLGTANDLARTLGISENLAEACTTIIENHRSRMDLGVVNDCYFCNVANIGLGTRITQELTSEVKKQWGILSYLKALFTAFSGTRTFRATLTIDEHEYRLRSIQIAVGNGRYYGGGNVIDENAWIDDGLLSLYCLKPLTFRELLFLAPLLRSGSYNQERRIFNKTGKHIDIRTSQSMQVHADGEPLTQTPATFTVIKNALEVVVPQQPGTEQP